MRVTYSATPNGGVKIRGIGEAKSPRGALPTDFLPFPIMDAGVRGVEFDSEAEMIRWFQEDAF